ncbi:MAG: phosphoglucosamine mutase, partial [Ignisphaera sp.]
RIVTAISTSHFLVQKNIVSRGIDVIWTKVGFLNIARKIKELGSALSGFEDNGGFAYIPHQLVRDGSMTAALVTEMISTETRSLSQFINEVENPVIIRTKIPISSREEVFKIIETLRNSFTNYNRIEIDGIKIVTNSYAFLVRPSGTEPLIRITVESWDRDIAERVLTELISIIQKSRGDIN